MCNPDDQLPPSYGAWDPDKPPPAPSGVAIRVNMLTEVGEVTLVLHEDGTVTWER